MKLDFATVLLQWATGGLAFGWVTTRHRLLGAGYGWLVRAVFGSMAVLGAVFAAETTLQAGSALVALAAAGALVASVIRRGELFEPRLDLIAPILGVVVLCANAPDAGGPLIQTIARLLVGAALLGIATDAMLLGHWYLVQPGLSRDPLGELVKIYAIIWPLELAVMLWPTGMIQVMSGSIDDGWGGLLGYMWVGSTILTIGLVGVAWLALRERYYSAVMSATGLLYLAILTAAGMDLVARAVLSP